MRSQEDLTGASGDNAGTGAVGRTLGVLADTWTLLILQRAFLGVRRYAGWRESLNISDATLTARLRSLTEEGLLSTRPYREGGRARLEYRLTERGRDTGPLLLAIWDWERRWVPREIPLPPIVHTDCGRATELCLSCASCGEPVGPHDTCVEVYRSTVPSGLARVHPRRARGRLPADPLSLLPGAMEVVGDRWGATVLGASLLGLRTFSQFEERLGISSEVLADRLRRFVELGVLDRSSDTGYRLTDKGRAAFPIHACLTDWAHNWLVADGVPSDLEIRHPACGNRLRVRLDCTVCGRPVGRDGVSLGGLGGM